LENWELALKNAELLRRPVVEVSIGGTIVERHASLFAPAAQAGFHAAKARLLYPADYDAGNIGDAITVSLVSENTKDRYFSGVIYSANTHGKHRELRLADGYKKLCETDFIAAYRKEKAASILGDILGAALITEKALTCPDVILARFSTRSIPARLCIDLLIDALAEYGFEGLGYFFDAEDSFHFGTAADTGKNEGGEENFETGKNITRSGSGWIEVLPRPIRHTQQIVVNNKTMLTVRTDVTVSRTISRLTLWIREVI
jgi:hypothetical protein